MKKSSLAFIAVMLFILSPLSMMAQGNSFLKKYAGTYHMLVDGQKAPATPDKYIFTPDGKCKWIMTFKNDAGKMETKTTLGTWPAGEGNIQLKFDMGEGEGSELLSEFKLKNGVFHSNESVYLKKVVAGGTKAKSGR